jgi:2-dehydro-3-deoxyphosphogluconate aldolase / (4S)-4-hydroxy-2-oxoglutarate aldolase
MTSQTLINTLRAARVLPVLTIPNLAVALPLARALAAGGLRALEVTLRTPCALEAISTIARDCPDIIVGAGTIMTPEELLSATQAGARFALSPGATPALLEAGRMADIPFIPGVATASELMSARAHNYLLVKLFPAQTLGGVDLIKNLVGPIGDMLFCPTGGIHAGNKDAYLAHPNVVCVGGSWMAPAALIEAGRWQEITQLAAQALERFPVK